MCALVAVFPDLAAAVADGADCIARIAEFAYAAAVGALP